MQLERCPFCSGQRYGFDRLCRNCKGSGIAPDEDRPFAQCRSCYGTGYEEFDECPKCEGNGFIEVERIELYQPSDFSYRNAFYNYDEQSKIYVPQRQEIVTDLRASVAQLIIQAEDNPELLETIDPREFEQHIAEIFKRKGFIVELTKRTRDGGRDIIALKHELGIPVKFIIECKRYSESNKVGVELVRQLYGVQQAESANKSILVTTSSFTQGAIDFAKQHNTMWHMDLKSFCDVLNWTKDLLRDEPNF